MEIIFEIKNKSDKAKIFYLLKPKYTCYTKHHEDADFETKFSVEYEDHEQKLNIPDFKTFMDFKLHKAFIAKVAFTYTKEPSKVCVDRADLLYGDTTNRYVQELENNSRVVFEALNWLAITIKPSEKITVSLQVESIENPNGLFPKK